MRGNFDNSGKLVRFMLKREIIISTVWILILVLFSAALAPAMSGMFPSAEERQQFASTFNNPVMVAMMGPVYGADNYTHGAMYANMMLLWIIIAVAIMNIFLVVRHTRADEEMGRAEIVRSLPVGRLANLNATMITAVIVNVILGLLMGLGLAVTGVESITFAGSMLYGLVISGVGLAFAAVTALFCQLSSNKSGATGYSFIALGVFYMMRAAGDMNSEALAYLSPLGLALRSQVYVNNHWWPVLVLVIEGVIIAAIAYRLNAIRDLDQGFIPARMGRRDAKAGLLSPFGLSFRLLRNTIIVWLIVMFTLGASYGSIIGDISKFVGDSPQYLQILGMPAALVNTLSDAAKNEMIQKYFMSFVTSMMTLICIVPLLIAAMKAGSEEKANRAEPVLARSVPRGQYLAGFLVLAYALSALLPCASAVGRYLSASSLAGEANPFSIGALLGANLAYLPALWVMIGLAILLIGLLPKASGVLWGYFGFVCFASFIGEVIGLPDWLLGLAPLKHVSKVLLEVIDWTPLIVMTAIAVAMTGMGFVFYGKRDLAAQ